jgi:integrase/recombinase XerD
MTKSLSNGLEMLTAEEIHDITVRCHRGSELESITLGHRLLDDYVAFVAARARTNEWLAVASDLKIFFGVVAEEPTEVTRADVFGVLGRSARSASRRAGGSARGCGAGLAAPHDRPPVVECAWLYAYLAARGDTGVSRNPVPASLAAPRPGARRGKGGCAVDRHPADAAAGVPAVPNR